MSLIERKQDLKIGFFTLLGLLILVYATLQVSEQTFSGSHTYTVSMVLDSAVGLNTKTPVEIAGVQVGTIDSFELEDGRRARVILRINDAVKLTQDVQAQIRTKGFLGESYVDLVQGESDTYLSDASKIEAVNPYVDLNKLTNELYAISEDVKLITGNMKGHFTEGGNWDVTMENMAILSEKLNESAEHIASISKKIDNGEGTVGKLVNDEETIDNLNRTVEGLSETLGAANRFQTEFGYHMEYLGESNNFKSYVGLKLKPRPDKYFQVDFAVDPAPPPDQRVTTSQVTAGGATTTVVTDQSTVSKNKFLVSAQLAKTFYDFTLRGGVIESTGGAGLDYNYGPAGLEFSAFDFRTDGSDKPHLKVLGHLNLTKNLYLVSGVDDFISNQQDPDWFLGAGFRIIDEDIKALFGVSRLR